MNISISEFLKDPENNSDNYYGFYDWFCSDNSLKRRMLALVPKLKFLVKEGIVNPDNTYVWFKNNCPCDGTLYDDMRFSTLNDSTFLGGICPKSGHYSVEDEASIWFIQPRFEQFNFSNWSSLKKEIQTNPEFRQNLTINLYHRG